MDGNINVCISIRSVFCLFVCLSVCSLTRWREWKRSLCKLCCMSLTAFSSTSPSRILSRNDILQLQSDEGLFRRVGMEHRPSCQVYDRGTECIFENVNVFIFIERTAIRNTGTCNYTRLRRADIVLFIIAYSIPIKLACLGDSFFSNKKKEAFIWI